MCTFTVKKTIDLLAAVANGDDKAEILCLKKSYYNKTNKNQNNSARNASSLKGRTAKGDWE